jgi:transcriptional regulator with XRE-family HTH domain
MTSTLASCEVSEPLESAAPREASFEPVDSPKLAASAESSVLTPPEPAPAFDASRVEPPPANASGAGSNGEPPHAIKTTAVIQGKGNGAFRILWRWYWHAIDGRKARPTSLSWWGMARTPLTARFGAKIRDVRLARGLSQADLATKIGLSPNHLGVLERGEKAPTLETVEAIADALALQPADLFSDGTPPDPWLEQVTQVATGVPASLRAIALAVLAAFAQPRTPSGRGAAHRRPAPPTVRGRRD